MVSSRVPAGIQQGQERRGWLGWQRGVCVWVVWPCWNPLPGVVGPWTQWGPGPASSPPSSAPEPREGRQQGQLPRRVQRRRDVEQGQVAQPGQRRQRRHHLRGQAGGQHTLRRSAPAPRTTVSRPGSLAKEHAHPPIVHTANTQSRRAPAAQAAPHRAGDAHVVQLHRLQLLGRRQRGDQGVRIRQLGLNVLGRGGRCLGEGGLWWWGIVFGGRVLVVGGGSVEGSPHCPCCDSRFPLGTCRYSSSRLGSFLSRPSSRVVDRPSGRFSHSCRGQGR